MTALKLIVCCGYCLIHCLYLRKHTNKDKPKNIVKYDKYMGGMERTDQMIAKACLKVLKWWEMILFHILTLICLNSYLMYKRNVTNPMSQKFQKTPITNCIKQNNQ